MNDAQQVSGNSSNINTIEDVMENMMCDLGIGGLGIEDVKPRHEDRLTPVDRRMTTILGNRRADS